MKATLAIGLSSLGLVAIDSHDARASWVLTNGPSGTQVQALVSAPSRVFAATHAGLFSTSDYSTWIFDAGLGPLNVSSVATSVSTPDRLIAGTLGNGIFRSLDYGESWLESNSGLTDRTVHALA